MSERNDRRRNGDRGARRSGRASTSSAIRAARCCRSMTRCSSRRRCSTSWCGTSRARCMPPKAMRVRPARSAACWSPRARARPMRSPASPTRYATRSRSSCITGQVPTHLIGNDAFQECDTVGITRPCTKHNYLVKSIADLPRVLHEAFHIAASGRPGPVVVDIPKDIQFAKGIYSRPKNSSTRATGPSSRATSTGSRQAVELMAHAKRPLFYTGGGVINSGPRGQPAAARAGQAHRLSDHLDADGARRLSGLRSAMARHARHARHLGSQLGDARLRS